MNLTLNIEYRWWFRPYWALTKAGLWLGLPLNPEVVAKDLVRGMKFTARVDG